MNEKLKLLNDLIDLQQMVQSNSHNNKISENEKGFRVLEELEKKLSEGEHDSFKSVLVEILTFSVLHELNKRIEETMEEIKKELQIPKISVSNSITWDPGWNIAVNTPYTTLTDSTITTAKNNLNAEAPSTTRNLDAELAKAPNGYYTGDQPIVTSVTTSTTNTVDSVDEYTKR